MFQSLAGRCQVPEDDYYLLLAQGVTAPEEFFFKIPNEAALEAWIVGTLYLQTGTSDDQGNFGSQPRNSTLSAEEFTRSDTTASVRRLWYISKEMANNDLKNMANQVSGQGMDSNRRKPSVPYINELRSQAATRGVTDKSDRDKVGNLCLIAIVENFRVISGKFSYQDFEAFTSQEEEDYVADGTSGAPTITPTFKFFVSEGSQVGVTSEGDASAALKAAHKQIDPVNFDLIAQIGLQACQASCQRGAASYPSLSQIRPAMSSRFEECRRPPDPKSSWPTEWSQAPMRRKILPVSAKMKTSPSVEELLDKFPESLFWAERSQSEIGSSTSLRVLSMSAGNAWSRSSFTSLSDEKVAQKRIAVDMLLEVIAFLESRKVDVGARHLVTSESELRELLIPRRPGTTIRVCRMFRRFQKFVEADPLSSMEIQPQLEVDAGIVGRWMRDLVAHKVGKNTLIAALGCLSHLSELLAFEYNGDNKLLRNLSSRYAEGHEHEVNQATEYSVKWLQWAESMVLGQFQLPNLTD
jgi:hypothetical protein